MTFKVWKSDHSRIAWAAVTNYLETIKHHIKITAYSSYLEVDTTAMGDNPKLGAWAEEHVYNTIQSYIDR